MFWWKIRPEKGGEIRSSECSTVELVVLLTDTPSWKVTASSLLSHKESWLVDFNSLSCRIFQLFSLNNFGKRSCTCRISSTTNGWRPRSSWRESAVFGVRRSGPDSTNGASTSPNALAGCAKRWLRTTCSTFIIRGDPSWRWATLMMPSTTREIKTWRQSIGEHIVNVASLPLTRVTLISTRMWALLCSLRWKF